MSISDRLYKYKHTYMYNVTCKSVTIRASMAEDLMRQIIRIYLEVEPNVPQITSCKELPHDCERREVHIRSYPGEQTTERNVAILRFPVNWFFAHLYCNLVSY